MSARGFSIALLSLCAVVLPVAPRRAAAQDNPPVVEATPRAETPLAEWNAAAETVVLFNATQPTSEALAREYAEARGIAPDRLVGLPCSGEEIISRDEFETSIREPLLRRFVERRWWHIEKREILDPNGRPHTQAPMVIRQDVRVLVIMRGVPLGVRSTKQGVGPAADADEASVDSELAAIGLLNRRIRGTVENRYYQSTRRFPQHETAQGQLIVGRLDGPDDATVRRMMADTLRAEREGLWGRAVVDFGLMGAGYEEGEQWLGRSVAAFRQHGIPMFTDRYREILRDAWPLPDTILYFGWYTENCGGALASPGFRFKAGAIACHLHSCSAETIRSRTDHWCGPLLDRGAAAVLGNVWEPYLALTVHFDILNARLLSGMTLGEAAWAATPGISWMNVLVGDPLYRPFPNSRSTPADTSAVSDYVAFGDLTRKYLQHDGKKLRRELLRLAAERKRPHLIELAALLTAVEGNHGQAADFLQHAQALYTAPEDKLRCALYDAELSRRSGDVKECRELLEHVLQDRQFAPLPSLEAARAMLLELGAATE